MTYHIQKELLQNLDSIRLELEHELVRVRAKTIHTEKTLEAIAVLNDLVRELTPIPIPDTKGVNDGNCTNAA